MYADAYCYRGVIPISEAEEILGHLTDVAKFYFGDKRSAVTYRITGGEVSHHTFEFCLRFEECSNRPRAVGVQLPSLRGRFRPSMELEGRVNSSSHP